MRNRSRLDLICVPLAVDHQIDPASVDRARPAWEAAGLLDGGSVTPAMLDGGGKGVRLDRPDARVVYGNQLGGFRVRCPACGEGMARDFARAMEQARQAGPLEATCASCGAVHPFDDLRIRPPVRVGRSALVFEDVNGPQLTVAGHQAVEAVVGPFAVVLRRVS